MHSINFEVNVYYVHHHFINKFKLYSHLFQVNWFIMTVTIYTLWAIVYYQKKYD